MIILHDSSWRSVMRPDLANAVRSRRAFTGVKPTPDRTNRAHFGLGVCNIFRLGFWHGRGDLGEAAAALSGLPLPGRVLLDGPRMRVAGAR